MEERLAVAGNHDPENDGDKSEVDERLLPLAGEHESKDGGEEGSSGPHCLVEGDGDVTQRGVAADDGEAEDGGEGGDFEELAPGGDLLERDEAEPVDGGETVDGAGDHVDGGEEDRVLIAVDAEEVLVQEKDADVGEIPGRDY